MSRPRDRYHAVVPGYRFGERLTQAREAAGFTPRELARRADVLATDINRWERTPDMDVRISTVRALARALSVSTDYLLGLSDDPAPPNRIATDGAASSDALTALDEGWEGEERRTKDRRRRERRTR